MYPFPKRQMMNSPFSLELFKDLSNQHKSCTSINVLYCYNYLNSSNVQYLHYFYAWNNNKFIWSTANYAFCWGAICIPLLFSYVFRILHKLLTGCYCGISCLHNWLKDTFINSYFSIFQLIRVLASSFLFFFSIFHGDQLNNVISKSNITWWPVHLPWVHCT